MRLFLLLQQYPACLVRLILIDFVMGGRWPVQLLFLAWVRSLNVKNNYISNNSVEQNFTVSMSKTVLLQTIQFSTQKQFYFKQFSISTHFSSIWPIDMTLSGATTPAQSGPGSFGQWMRTLHFPKLQLYWSFTIRSFKVTYRTLIGGVCLMPLQRYRILCFS